MADSEVGEKRKADDADASSPNKKLKAGEEATANGGATEKKEVGEKRKGDQTESNPNKKRKIKHQKFDPCVIRRKIQEFFKDKKTDDSKQLEEFFKTCKVSKFKDFGFRQRTFYEFIKEHNISWKDGEVAGPSDEWIQSKIREQMHFYFSDANLPRDNFLLKEIAKSDERWVTLAVFKKFKLIAKWSTDIEDLKSAIASSKKLELDAAKKNVRRKDKCTITKWDIERRTTKIHGYRFAKGKVNLLGMKEYFSQWGLVAAVFPRKPKHGHVGSLEVVWGDEKTAVNFRTQKTLTYQEDELTIKQEVVIDKFDNCFKFDKATDKFIDLKKWLKELGLGIYRAENLNGKTYIWSKNTFADVEKALAKAEDAKKYGEYSAVEQGEWDQVFTLFNQFKPFQKKDKFKKQRNAKRYRKDRS